MVRDVSQNKRNEMKRRDERGDAAVEEEKKEKEQKEEEQKEEEQEEKKAEAKEQMAKEQKKKEQKEKGKKLEEQKLEEKKAEEEKRQVFTLGDVAEMTGFTQRTIRNYMKRGLLKGRLIKGAWQFTGEDLESFFEERFVKQGLEGKAANLVAHFLEGGRKPEDTLCSVYDLSVSGEEEGKKLCDGLLGKINTAAFQEIQYSYHYDKKAGRARILLTGKADEIMELMELLRDLRKPL